MGRCTETITLHGKNPEKRLGAGLEQAGLGARKQGMKIDLKLDLHPSVYQHTLASLLKLDSTALQVSPEILKYFH